MASFATSNPSRAASSKSASLNLKQSYRSPKPIHALLSIKPRYAEAIFSGEKRFEFRRVGFKRAVSRVFVYSTSPVSRVAGEFRVETVITDNVDALWNRTKEFAGIERKHFFRYFAGRKVGHAIAIGAVRRYRRPIEISTTFGIRPPQSFAYVLRRGTKNVRTFAPLKTLSSPSDHLFPSSRQTHALRTNIKKPGI